MIGFRHNSPESLRKKLERLPGAESNRLVVVEGLYSIRGDVAPLRDIVSVCRAHHAYLLVDEAHSLGTYGATGLGCAEDQGVLDEVDFIVGTFSKSLAGIGGVCVSNHPELRALHFLARAYVFTASGSPSNIASVAAAVDVVRAHPELRDQLWANVRRLRRGLQELGYAIGSTESPIVPILTGDEERTIALWQYLLNEGLYVNLIVPPGCPRDECVLRASCSAAHSPEQLTRADGDLSHAPCYSQPSRRYHAAACASPSSSPTSATTPRRSRRRSTRHTKPVGGQLGVAAAVHRQRLPADGSADVAEQRHELQYRQRYRNDHRAASNRVAHALEQRTRGDRFRVADEEHIAARPSIDRRRDRAHQIRNVDERIGGRRASDVRQHATRREHEQRQQCPVAGAVHDARSAGPSSADPRWPPPPARLRACCGRRPSSARAGRLRFAAPADRPDPQPPGWRCG